MAHRAQCQGGFHQGLGRRHAGRRALHPRVLPRYTRLLGWWEVELRRGGASGQRAWLEWGVRDWRERQFLMVPSPGAGFPLVLPSQ